MMGYAEYINRMVDEIESVIARMEQAGLTKEEIAEELRRIATQLEQEK